MKDAGTLFSIAALALTLAGCVTPNRATIRADVVRACAYQPTVAEVNAVAGAAAAGPAGAAAAGLLNAAEAIGCAFPR